MQDLTTYSVQNSLHYPQSPSKISTQLSSQAYLYQTHWQNSIIRSPLSPSSVTHIQAQILRTLFLKRFFASLELSSHQSQIFLSTNFHTILFNSSSIQHTVSFTLSVPLPPQNTPILFLIPLNFTTFLTHLQFLTRLLRTARITSEHPRNTPTPLVLRGYIKRLFTYLLYLRYHCFESETWSPHRRHFSHQCVFV